MDAARQTEDSYFEQQSPNKSSFFHFFLCSTILNDICFLIGIEKSHIKFNLLSQHKQSFFLYTNALFKEALYCSLCLS
jgi:hypothetical protein